MNAIARLLLIIVLAAGGFHYFSKVFTADPVLKMGFGIGLVIVVVACVGIILRQIPSANKPSSHRDSSWNSESESSPAPDTSVDLEDADYGHRSYHRPRRSRRYRNL